MKTNPAVPPQLASVLNDIGRFLPMIGMFYTPSDPKVAAFLRNAPAVITAINSGDQKQMATAAAAASPVLKSLLADLRASPIFGDLIRIIATSDLDTIEGELAQVAKKG